MNSRKIAFEVLNKVFQKNKFSNLLLNEIRNNENYEKSELNFITRIVYGTIEYKLYLEYVLNKIIDSTKTKYEIQILIWIAIYEFKFLNKPGYAIANEYVQISKGISNSHSGFVNGVLKKIFSDESLFDVNIKNKKNKLALKNGLPFFIYQKISLDYGKEVADKFTLNLNLKRKNTFRINTLKTSSESFYENLNFDYDFTPSKIARDCFKTDLNLIGSKIFREGLIYAQDECSVLVSQILEPKINSKVLDMCCAPGGKLTHISALMKNSGEVWGNDIATNKFDLIKENIKRLGCTNIKLINKSALEITESNFDFILLDAPCSGLGVMNKKPEIRLKKPDEIFNNSLIKIQRQLLEKASSLLKKGGELVYSTCTINKDENINQIDWFLSKNLNFLIVESHQFFGFEYNTDGFFICKLKKMI